MTQKGQMTYARLHARKVKTQMRLTQVELLSIRHLRLKCHNA